MSTDSYPEPSEVPSPLIAVVEALMAVLPDRAGALWLTARAAADAATLALCVERNVRSVMIAPLVALSELTPPPPPPSASARPAHASPDEESRFPPLRERMTTLLQRARSQSSAGGRLELYHKLLDQIVPDEAAIIAALSDGGCAATATVSARSMPGRPSEVLVEHASLVGRTANVALPHLTPTYVAHLLAMGLVELGPEDESLDADYQVLAADPGITAAMRGGSRGPLPPKLERSTLRLSRLGLELWRATVGTS